MLTGVQAKSVLTQALLRKSFVLNDSAKHKYPPGKVTSLMGTDLARIDFSIGFQPFAIVFPIPVVIAIAILIVNIGVSAVVGIVLLLIFLVVIGSVFKPLMEYRKEATKFTDLRVSTIKEVLVNLKMIKFYSWEDAYHEKIADYRTKEMKVLFRIEIIRNIMISLAMTLTLFSSMIAFLVLYGIGTHSRDPASIFSSISLFNILTQQVLFVPMSLNSAADAFVALKRVGLFLSSGESRTSDIVDEHANLKSSNVALEVNNANFEWEIFPEEEPEETKEEKKERKKREKKEAKEQKMKKKQTKGVLQDVDSSDVELVKEDDKHKLKEEDKDDIKEKKAEVTFTGLNNINLSIKKGEFIVITGVIGSGKSSLLYAMSGLMKKLNGTVGIEGSHILCSSPPWIQSNTVKENILFGSNWDEKKYNQIIYACALESDLEILPAGDNTEIGERGITLSGGQKARINLARAVYANSDIILLDDVLSAVDARVGKHIMDSCILGLLKDKTRILATHQLSLIGTANRIIFLNGDGSIDVGSLEELRSRNSGFNKLMEHNHAFEDVKSDDVEATDTIDNDEEAIHKDFNVNKLDDGKLVEEEEKAVNQIGLTVYMNYLRIGSGKFTPWVVIPLVVISITLATFCSVFTNTWLSLWIEYRFPAKSDAFYIGLYVMFTVLAFIFLAFEFGVLVYVTNRAANKLNVLAVNKIVRVPLSFMDVTPMGRVLNRFTKDTDVLDNELGDQIRFLLFMFSSIVGIIVLCIVYLPWFAIAVPMLIFIFVAAGNYYQASAREIKRLEAVQRSFVFNNFEETLNGISTIKAFNAESIFLNKSSHYIDKVNEAAYLVIAAERWLGINLDMIATMITLLIAFLCVFRVFDITPAAVGLLLSYVLGVAGQLPMLIRTYTLVENEMNSAERLSSYAFKLPQEASFDSNGISPPPDWPKTGAIDFDDVSLCYRPGLPVVLKNITFKVNGNERIGICGRTGAGKSSITTALYRLSELQGGKITIDGVNISEIGLRELRSKLSIIPQDPVLFAGTIRSNLDPFNQSTDDKLWDCLRRTGLIDGDILVEVKSQYKPAKDEKNILHKFHLDQNVEDGGSNFSLGERQLLSFARALVRDSKILILDEATSSVDYETDAKIQVTISKEFSNCTILCIAHRLKTVLHYEKILVLDKGEIKEFDTPWALFKSNGIFREMCDRAKIQAEDFIH
ncbi:P-loop containing nucleoside triphosphate hydrolase protein, partial [Scheffersomyces amazonensis]|uniref:P-loop containing nucleoside triphosphate hydrolase protein n=1 Tax=Scheffersomyces amazonensis TaxID=1078765 RepID=UPI00315CB878